MGMISGKRLAPVDGSGGNTAPTQTSPVEELQAPACAEADRASGTMNSSMWRQQSPAAQKRVDDEKRAEEATGGLFPSGEAMKERVRQQMLKPKYDVANYYHTSGFTQWIARHPRFEHATLMVIALNALWIWIDTDHNPGPMLLSSPPFFQVVEHLFCMYFTFEWAMRFGAFKRKRNGLKDAWFVFDSFLVATMVFETWLMTSVMLMAGGGGGLGGGGILRMARLLRLSRMARMARLLRAMPELLIIIKGMVAAMRSVTLTLGLLVVMLYIFGIAFVQLCDDTPCQAFFPNVPEAMHELLLNAALMDGLGNLVLPLKEQSLALLLVLYAFIFLSALTVMNMLIGVICEVVSAVAETERESISLSFVREKIQQLLEETGADEDGDHQISKDEFMRLVTDARAIPILEDVGVDVVGLLDIKDTLFEKDVDLEDDGSELEEKTLSFSDLMEVVLDLRGGNTATVRDIVNLRKYIHSHLTAIEQKLTKRFSHGRQAIVFPPEASGGRPHTVPSVTSKGGLKERVPESTSKSDYLSSSVNLGATPALQETMSNMLSNMRGLISKHEAEVAALEADNRKLKEQVAQTSKDLSKFKAVCSEFGLQPPKESLSSPQRDQSCSWSLHHVPPLYGDDRQEPAVAFSTELRAAADGSAVDSAKQSVNANGVAAANASSHRESAFGWSTREAPERVGTATCKVVAASSAAMSVASRSAEEPW